jgi:hypothetical protein
MVRKVPPLQKRKDGPLNFNDEERFKDKEMSKAKNAAKRDPAKLSDRKKGLTYSYMGM